MRSTHRCRLSGRALLLTTLLLSCAGCATSRPLEPPPPPVVVDCQKLPPLPEAASRPIPSGFYSRSEARTKQMLDWLTTWPPSSPPATRALERIAPSGDDIR